MEWISVKDRLPEEGGRFWCFVEEINDLGRSHFQWNCSFDPLTELFSDNFKTLRVTHWIPLAENPKP
jgi:hypothetical protein